MFEIETVLDLNKFKFLAITSVKIEFNYPHKQLFISILCYHNNSFQSLFLITRLLVFINIKVGTDFKIIYTGQQVIISGYIQAFIVDSKCTKIVKSIPFSCYFEING